ncbi:hypothetical protein L5B81_21500 [Pseudomonas aeruginosa]|uniref:hypothetical protein n=1 Tax=Pseudomonas aeruginosa TaxID=287 RepID=UPI00192AC9D5|nr:hypothetical protein [Pseudomonas aeruginosa]MBL4549734.1 hypothetical protein [Pseudomonas aeruginosa]MDG3603639.1 hypothetical protein [Pseudomonas aeruginosa]MDG3788626.1 hypothetical protein [Pseudomonas aeruginosa]MDG4118734.1 hypothetical protein [Pseudomonas aeruginosa]MDG4136011.1 hypothetical protein [Pseudomonas aeruginosa]
MTTSKIQMDQIRSTSATDTGENIRAGSQKKSSLSPAEGLQGASPDATCTCPSGDGSLRHPCPVHPAVEQAGGDERDLQGAQGERDGWGPLPIVQVPWNVFDRAVMWVEDRRRYGDDGTIVDDWKALKTIQRAALEQPSPAQAEQAEADLRRLAEAAEFGGGAHEDIEFSNQLDFHAACTPAAIVALLDEIDRLKAENERLANDRDRANRFANTAALDKDAALARVAELERQEPLKLSADVREFLQEGINSVMGGEDADIDYEFAGQLGKLLDPVYAAPVAQAQHSAGYAEARQCANCRHIGINDACADGNCPECGGFYELEAQANVPSQAQHSVPEGFREKFKQCMELAFAEIAFYVSPEKARDPNSRARKAGALATELHAMLAAAPGKEVGHE